VLGPQVSEISFSLKHDKLSPLKIIEPKTKATIKIHKAFVINLLEIYI